MHEIDLEIIWNFQVNILGRPSRDFRSLPIHIMTDHSFLKDVADPEDKSFNLTEVSWCTKIYCSSIHRSIFNSPNRIDSALGPLSDRQILSRAPKSIVASSNRLVCG